MSSDSDRRVPTLASDNAARAFPFVSWALANGFRYPPGAEDLLRRCDNAAQAFFVREFVEQTDTQCSSNIAEAKDGTTLRVQVRTGTSRIGAVVQHGALSLAILIQPAPTKAGVFDQHTSCCLRERRLLALGHIVVRFDANEIFADVAACWGQLYRIREVHSTQTTAGANPRPTAIVASPGGR